MRNLLHEYGYKLRTILLCKTSCTEETSRIVQCLLKSAESFAVATFGFGKLITVCTEHFCGVFVVDSIPEKSPLRMLMLDSGFPKACRNVDIGVLMYVFRPDKPRTLLNILPILEDGGFSFNMGMSMYQDMCMPDVTPVWETGDMSDEELVYVSGWAFSIYNIWLHPGRKFKKFLNMCKARLPDCEPLGQKKRIIVRRIMRKLVGQFPETDTQCMKAMSYCAIDRLMREKMVERRNGHYLVAGENK